MRETIFKWALKALTGIGEFLAELALTWLKTGGAKLALEWVPSALELAQKAGTLSPEDLGLAVSEGGEIEKSIINAARRDWVFSKLRAMAIRAGREIPSSVLNTAIEIAVQKLKA